MSLRRLVDCTSTLVDDNDNDKYDYAHIKDVINDQVHDCGILVVIFLIVGGINSSTTLYSEHENNNVVHHGQVTCSKIN